MNYANVPDPHDPRYRKAVATVGEKMREADEERAADALEDADLEKEETAWRQRHGRHGGDPFDEHDPSPRVQLARQLVAQHDAAQRRRRHHVNSAARRT